MKPDFSAPADHQPTIPGIAGWLVKNGLDRGSLVWPKDTPAGTTHPNGVAVFLLTRKAVRDLGPFLREYAKTFLHPDAHARFHIDQTTTVPQIMKAMHAAGNDFGYVNLDTGGVIWIAISPVVNQALADYLTAHGCLTNLT